MSTITMTKKGNARMDGVKYKAIPSDACAGCAFRRLPACVGVHCAGVERRGLGYKLEDPVIFVRPTKPVKPPTEEAP